MLWPQRGARVCCPGQSLFCAFRCCGHHPCALPEARGAGWPCPSASLGHRGARGLLCLDLEVLCHRFGRSAGTPVHAALLPASLGSSRALLWCPVWHLPASDTHGVLCVRLHCCVIQEQSCSKIPVPMIRWSVPTVGHQQPSRGWAA